MRLYHFINAKYGLEDLRDKRLKIARIMELNDPFEFLGADLSDHEFRESMQNLKKFLSEKYGLLCFSESWDNPVQWAHYADGHKGLCLGFDVLDQFLDKVNYVDERLPVDGFLADMEATGTRLSREMDDYIGQPASPDEFEKKKAEFREKARNTLRKESRADGPSLDLVKKIIATKFSHWSYEREYRCYLPLENKAIKEIDGRCYADFSDEILKIKEVIVGLRSPVARAQIEATLGEMAGGVEIFKARADDRKFALVRDENNAF